MVSIEQLIKFAKSNLYIEEWEIDSPLMKPYLAFYLFNNQLFTVLDKNGDILGFCVMARNYYALEFLRGVGRGWYFIDDYKYGDIGCVDLLVVKTGIGKEKALKVINKLKEMLINFANREGLVVVFSSRLKQNNTFVRMYTKKEVVNGKVLWVCRTVGFSKGKRDDIYLIKDILSNIERCRIHWGESIQSYV